MIKTIVATHVLAGALWALTALIVAVTRHASRILLGLQTAAAFIALLAGIALWHMLHAGPFGAAEHWLIVGTLLALIALSLQLGIAAPALLGSTGLPISGHSLVLARVGAVILLLAAGVMIRSMYA